MQTNRELWCGAGRRSGILQRLGGTLMVLSFAVIVIACQLAPTASFVYAALVAAHVLLYTGFALATVADALAHRPFSWLRLTSMLCVAFCYAVSGPILMSAVVAAQTTRLHLSGVEYRPQ